MKIIAILIGVAILAPVLVVFLIEIGVPGGVAGGMTFLAIFFGSMVLAKSLKKKGTKEDVKQSNK